MVEIENNENVMTAVLSGDIDHHRCAVIRKKIDARADSERPKVLVLDFSRVQFMDSSGVGLVMGRYRQMSLLGGRLKVINVPENIDKVFRLSGLERLGVME
ncbi:MAG: anti-sigma factor antagonist [Ruminococcus sp.]|nr:anti-sigma factor antagonist [Ruminococcus sp.]